MGYSENLPVHAVQAKSRWRWARWILLSLLAISVLVGLFYTEENWRGKHAWERYRHGLEAQGHVFDWSTRIPPTVPDDQNFFKAPRMAEWFVGRGTNDLVRRLTNPLTSTVNSTNAPKTAAEARAYLTWSDQFAPDIELIRTALKRPYARIDCDYSQPTTVKPPNFLGARILAQTLAQRAHCYFILGEPDKALEELTLLNDYCRILEAAPSGRPITLVAAMINIAIRGLYSDTIADGLRQHAWRDAQLSVLERQISAIHLETSLAETLVDEPMFIQRILETMPRSDLINMLRAEPTISSKPLLLLRTAPRGWFYHYMVFHARLNQRTASGFDTAKPQVNPRLIDETGRELQDNIQHVSSYNFMAPWWTPNWVKAFQRYSLNQTSLSQSAVACALERYRLARGEFPETLEALVPQFIEKLPHDIIGGGSMKYRRTPDGAFVLYSIGWNENDDGGTPGKSVENGDWVWQNPVYH